MRAGSPAELEMGNPYESLEVERAEIKKADSWRNKLLMYPIFALVVLVTFVALKTYKKFGADMTYSAEQVQVDPLFTGTQFLFDFGTEDGALEKTSVHDSADYQDVLRSIAQHADYWMKQVGVSELADETDMYTTWDAADGVVPWLANERDYRARVPPRLFNNPTAPHIVFFVVDDWGYNDIGYHSTYMNWTTPNIDKLATKGVKLANYYTHEFCVPSRAALLTGRYALRFGMHTYMNETDRERLELPTVEVTLAEELKTAGYHTNLVGKWHLGWSRDSKTPNYRGFDYFYGYLGGILDYWTKDFEGYVDLRENDKIIRDEDILSNTTHTAFIFERKAEDVIEDHARDFPGEPMFLYYASQLIHSDWSVPQEYLLRCSNVVDNSTLTHPSMYYVYCGMNLLLDEVIGNLTCALEKYNMSDNTLFILVSDNGGLSRMDGNNYPYRGAKGSLFRGAQSVPAFILGPDSILPRSRQGATYEGQMHVTDWLPTLMGIASGGEWRGSFSGALLDGVNMLPAIRDDASSPRRSIVHYADNAGNISYQYDNMKLVRSSLRVLSASEPLTQFLGEKMEVNACINNLEF